MSEEYTIAKSYPAGLKPWDGRFYKADPSADIVVLTLSGDGRSAREYAFRFADDAFQVLGRRERYLTRLKRQRWTPSALVSLLAVSWVPWEVFAAAVSRWQAERVVIAAMLTKPAP